MRRLNADEQQLWKQLAETVTPLKGRREVSVIVPIGANLPSPSLRAKRGNPVAPTTGLPRSARNDASSSTKPVAHPNTLDANWDKRLSKGTVTPDRTIDLHGHHLNSAHAMLDLRLGEAVRSGARLVLLITGRPARDNPRLPPTSRGVIRASVMDWIAAGPWASHIAAVRGAHPRHGGAGALYLIIRRAR